MNWFKSILLAIATANMVISPVWAANGSLTTAEQAKFVEYKNTLEKYGYQVHLDPNEKIANVYDELSNSITMRIPLDPSQRSIVEPQIAKAVRYKNVVGPAFRVNVDFNKQVVYLSRNGVTTEIPLTKDSELRDYSPGALNRKLLEELATAGAAGRAAFSHSLQNLPAESMMFLMAMGAVVATHLFTNYAKNPLAMQQHIEHQLSPIGLFGFYVFMASQGLTSNLLALYTSNPRFQYFIPYIGMSVGSFMQTYLSQFIADPNVWACGKELIGDAKDKVKGATNYVAGLASGKNNSVKQETKEDKTNQQNPPKVSLQDSINGVASNPCDKAHEYFVLKKKIWEAAPGIVTALTATAMAGGTQWAAGKALSKVGFKVGLLLMPGGMELKSVQLLLKGAQIYIFGTYQDLIAQRINLGWKNFFDGNEFYEYNENLNQQMTATKTSQWTSIQGLVSEIENLHNKMVQWRMTNLAEVYEAHSAWSENLNQLVSMYNGSYNFYGSFVDEVRNVRYDTGYVKPLLESYPLVGVKAKGMLADRADLYFQQPKMVENWQMDTVKDTVAFIDKVMSSQQFTSLYPAEKREIAKIREALASDDKMMVGQGLLALNAAYAEARKTISDSYLYEGTLKEIKKTLGNPDPSLEPGRGFMMTYEIAPTTGQNVNSVPFYRRVGTFSTPHITEYLLMQMICGPNPEIGEPLIRTTKGFPSVFMPPKLHKGDDDFGNVCYQGTGSGELPSKNIYSWTIRAQNKKEYKGFVDYLIGNTRSSVLGGNQESNFPAWWRNTTESQMTRAFEEFQKSYDQIVLKMLHTIYREERTTYSGVYDKIWENVSSNIKSYFDEKIWNKPRYDRDLLNRGPISNSTMNALFQEERIYLSILNEFLAPTDKYKVDFKLIQNQAPTHESLKKIEQQFAVLNYMIKSIRPQQLKDRVAVYSPLENYEIDAQYQKIGSAIKELAEGLGVELDCGDIFKQDENKAATANKKIDTKMPFHLDPNQKQVAKLTLEKLFSLGQEMMMYGNIANAVSWNKIQDLKREAMARNEFAESIKKKQEAMRKTLGVTGGAGSPSTGN